jgi:gluconokinase
MLDKIRLHAAGRLPRGYNLGTKVWTWFDARCTRFLAVNYEALVERTLRGGTDQEILAWCFEQGRRPSEEDIEIWNEFMTTRGWRDSSSAALAEAKRVRGFADRDDIQTAFEFHIADESSDETAIAEPCAPPNGRPAARLGDSGATEGPPSVS